MSRESKENDMIELDNDIIDAFFESQDEDFAEILKHADAGDNKAKFMVALAYLTGRRGEVEINPRKGFGILKQINEDEVPYVKMWLGLCFAGGIGTDLDMKQALPLLQSAHESGFVDATYYLASVHMTDKWHCQNIPKSIEYYKIAADQGNVEALYELADLYRIGEYVEADLEEAVRLYMLAAEQNHPDSIQDLGCMYQHGIGVERDERKALEYFKLAIEHDVSEAYYGIGLLFRSGVTFKKDIHEAINWFKAGAEKGDIGCCMVLGAIYLEDEEIEQDIEQSLKYFQIAEENGNQDLKSMIAGIRHAIDIAEMFGGAKIKISMPGNE